MELLPIFGIVLVLGCLTENIIVSASQLQVTSISGSELPHETTLSKLLTVYRNDMWGENERVKRSMKENIEKGFKEFSEKVSKLPDQLNANLKKFFEERGISMESIQKILNDIWEAVEKLINEVKKAM